MHDWVLFDWGDTLMRAFDYPGPMCSWPEVELLPGVLEVLQSLQGRVGIALATNAADSSEREIREALTRAGLEAFVAHIFCYRSVGHKKSSPLFFARVMQQLPGHHLVMVGDDFEQDVTAANAVGIKAVWFNIRNHESKTGANHRTIHEFTELPRILEEWGFLASGQP